jgi:hypothetical protein
MKWILLLRHNINDYIYLDLIFDHAIVARIVRMRAKNKYLGGSPSAEQLKTVTLEVRAINR